MIGMQALYCSVYFFKPTTFLFVGYEIIESLSDECQERFSVVS